LNSFRRVQVTVGVWGVILIVGGWLHGTFAGSWGVGLMLLIWLGLTVIGLLGSWLAAPEMLPSGMLFLWTAACIVPLAITWLIFFPLDRNGVQLVAPLWHLFFALGYYITGWFMDRRLWWLAGWETFLVVISLLISYRMVELSGIRLSGGLTFGLTSGIPLLLAALPIWREQYGTYKQRTRNRAESS
jgi:hypothetical protein